MKEIKQSMLVLLDRDSKLIYLIAKVIDLWSPPQMSDVLKVLQRPSDLRPVSLDLRSNVFQRRLGSRTSTIELKPEWHRMKYTAYKLSMRGAFFSGVMPDPKRDSAELVDLAVGGFDLALKAGFLLRVVRG